MPTTGTAYRDGDTLNAIVCAQWISRFGARFVVRWFFFFMFGAEVNMFLIVYVQSGFDETSEERGE